MYKGDTHLGWVCHFIIAFARRRSKMEDVTKSLQASASLLFCWKKVVLGLGERTKIRGSHAAPTEVPTGLNIFITTKNDAASAHLKTELPALQRKVIRKPGP
jgi:hypothetical protein